MVDWTIEFKDNKFVIPKDKNPYWRVILAQGFGEDCPKNLILSPIEVAFLVMQKRARCNLDLEKIFDIGSQFNKFFFYYLSVYTDLRKKRFIVKLREFNDTLIFELYPPNTDIFSTKPQYLVYVVPAEREVHLGKLESLLKHSQESIGKLTLAIVDQDGDIVYYDVNTILRYQVTLKLRKTTVP